MGKLALAERIGSVLTLVSTDTSVKVVRSFKIFGDFPADDGIEVVFDFVKDDQGVLSVQLERRTSNLNPTCNSWTLSAIEDRDPSGLKGFIEFASSLGLRGAQLAHLIEGLKPRG